MFDLGASLRAAREKRGLELDAVQRALRIRRRYLEAMEGERFELLPGEVYARGFLREYAEFLGLDGSIYVEEYNSRFAVNDEPAIAALPTAPRLRRSRTVPVIAGTAVAVAAALGLAAWQLGGSGGSAPPAAVAQPKPAAAARPHRPAIPAAPIVAAAAPAKPRLAQLVLRAARGDCWVIVRDGSASGPVLYENTLRRGNSLRIPVKGSVWLRVGAGAYLDAWVGGHVLRSLPHMTGNLRISV